MAPRRDADDLHVAPPRVRADDAFLAQLAAVSAASTARERRRGERGSGLRVAFAAASVAAVVTGGTFTAGMLIGTSPAGGRHEPSSKQPSERPYDRTNADVEDPAHAIEPRTGRPQRAQADRGRATDPEDDLPTVPVSPGTIRPEDHPGVPGVPGDPGDRHADPTGHPDQTDQTDRPDRPDATTGPDEDTRPPETDPPADDDASRLAPEGPDPAPAPAPDDPRTGDPGGPGDDDRGDQGDDDRGDQGDDDQGDQGDQGDGRDDGDHRRSGDSGGDEVDRARSGGDRDQGGHDYGRSGPRPVWGA